MLKIYSLFFSMLFFFSMSAQCDFTMFTATVDGQCDSDGNVLVIFDYDVANPGSMGYSIAMNGIVQDTISYADSYEIIVASDCDIEFEFRIQDIEDPNCFAETTIDVCCDCMLSNMSLNSGSCSGSDYGTFPLTVDFDYINPTEDNFKLWAGGTYFGSFALADLPVTVDVPNNLTDSAEVITCIGNYNQCCLFETIVNPCDGTGPCTMQALDFGANPICDGDNIVANWLISGYNVSEVGFDVFIDGDFEIFIPYEDDEWYSFEIGDPETETFILKVCDNDDSSCCIEHEFNNPCYTAPCIIENLTADITSCENDLFDVSINFDYDNVGNDGFSIHGNGVDYGDFSYNNLPILIEDLDPDCSLEYEFVITDISDNSCSSFIDVGTVCCGGACALSNLSLISGSCTGSDYGTFPLTVDFDYINPTEDNFKLWAGGTYFGSFALADLPVTVDVPNNLTDSAEVITCIGNYNQCCLFETIVNPCDGTGPCTMQALDFGANPICDGDNIVANWLISGYNVSEVGFDVFIDGDFEIFVPFEDDEWYSFEIGDPETVTFILKVCDNDDSSCCIEHEFNNPCYTAPCIIEDIVADITSCENDLFTISIDFDYDNVGNDGFSIHGNGIDYGDFSYNDLPILIEDLDPDCSLEYEFVITDISDNSCSSFIDVGTVCCGGACQLTILSLITGDCTGSDYGVFPLTIDFDYVNPTNDNFELWAGGIYFGLYPLTGLPITIDVPNNLNDSTNVTICINDNSQCCLNETIVNPCDGTGPCTMHTLDFGANPACDSGLIVTSWLIDGYNVSEVGFDVYINNVFEIYISYESNHWYDFDISDPGTDWFTIKICDNDDPTCCIDWEVLNPCYNTDSCLIENIVATVNDCENDQYNVSINFDYNNEGNDGFSIVGNGVDYGDFEYSDLPIILEELEADCSLYYEFIVTDINNNTCSDFIELGVVCCTDTCELSLLSLGAGACIDDSTYVLTIDFEYVFPTDDFFDLWISDDLIGNYNLNELPLVIVIDATTYTMASYIVEVCINDNNSCCIEAELDNPCYDATQGFVCAIEDGQLSVNIENGMLRPTIELLTSSTCDNSYNVWIDGVYIDEVSLVEGYLSLPDFISSNEYIEVEICNVIDEEVCINLTTANPSITSTENVFTSPVIIRSVIGESLTFITEVEQDINIKIYTLDGKLHYTRRSIISNTEYSVDITFWNRGVYLIEVITDGQRTIEKLFL